MYLQRNEGISASKFPASFNFANVTPAFKQGCRNVKDNYRPTHKYSKDFEKFMCKQLPNHFDNIFSRFQRSCRKKIGAQHCRLLLIDK